MQSFDESNILIVSDLHMSSGYDSGTGSYSRNEDFFYDDAFARFIAHYLQLSQDNRRRYRLVLLGDVVDFLQVEVPRTPEQGAQTSTVMTLRKLERIVEGHPVFFQALADWIAAGQRLDIVIGNHDIELVYPEVQTRFKELIINHGAGADAEQQIAFWPWFFLVPGLVYAEHGHQYDTDNSFLTQLRPFLPDNPNAVELPLGSFFVLYLFNHIERLDPFADNVRPTTRYLVWALRTHPWVVVRTLVQHVAFFINVVRKSGNPGSQLPTDRRAEYQQTDVSKYGTQFKLPTGTVIRIDERAAMPSIYSLRKVVQRLLIEPFIPGVPLLVAGMSGIYYGTRRLQQGLRAVGSLGFGISALFLRDRLARQPSRTRDYDILNNYLYDAALDIHTYLAEQGHDVPAYVFGHTHTPEQYPLSKGDGAPRYINTGTWTPVVPQTFDLLSRREQFTFVSIRRDATANDSGVVSELLRWNDDAGRAERFPALGVPALNVDVES